MGALVMLLVISVLWDRAPQLSTNARLVSGVILLPPCARVERAWPATIVLKDQSMQQVPQTGDYVRLAIIAPLVPPRHRAPHTVGHVQVLAFIVLQVQQVKHSISVLRDMPRQM